LKKKIAIFGAGAIGRGFIAPLFDSQKYQIDFIDTNNKLVKELNIAKQYTVGVTSKKKYIFNTVIFNKAYNNTRDKNNGIDIKKYDIVFSCVGPDNCFTNAKYYKNAKILISCENDIETVVKLKNLTSNQNIFFGIPDVITSNTAPKKILDKDKLSIISEQGILVVEKNKAKLPKKIKVVNKADLNSHWISKMYIHNAPHAIAAYLGHLKNYKFIHEAMSNKKINKIVKGAIKEITNGIISSNLVNRKFAIFYMKKEIKRFTNKLLYDPISRVARDPLRKLAHDNRLVKAIQVALFNKSLPKNCAIGIKAALKYFNKNDEQSKHLKVMIENFGEKYVLNKICGLKNNEALVNFCLLQKII